MDPITDFVRLLEIKRYSKSTIDNYKSQLFFAKLFLKDKSFKNASDQDLFELIYYLVHIKKISASYQRQIVGSLKLFYKEIFKRDIPFEYLKVSRAEKKLSVVLSKSEINAIINATHNIKHKALIALLYGSGLRIGELLNLTMNDIDSHRMLVHVRDAKGKRVSKK